MDKIKDFLPPVEKCPDISFTMRLASYLICLIVGFIMTVVSINKLCSYHIAHYRSFALWYTLSNIVWFISTFILIGTKSHYKKLISDQLVTKFIVLVCSIILGLLFGFLTSSKFINIFFSIVQFCSIIILAYSYQTVPNNNTTEVMENSYQNQNNNLFNELK